MKIRSVLESAVLTGLRLSPSFSLLGEPFSVAVKPTPLKNPCLRAINVELLAQFGVVEGPQTRQALLRLFSGAAEFNDYPTRASVYSGHQFGVYVPQLGDGRALLYAEVLDKNNTRHQWQLKGGGLTPYSRMGDGRAVLRSTIREYLCSEAMHHLGIPSTRSLCLISSDEPVARERIESGATMVRVARSFLRFGHFQYFAHTGQHEALRILLDHSIDEFAPEFHQHENEKYLHFFVKVMQETAALIAQWQAFGFAHGVMNTDNMSALGLTIDYGPFGFLDAFEPGYICNHSDHSGRYAFDEQPSVAFWNLCRFAEALLPVAKKEALGEALGQFEGLIVQNYAALMRKKLGLFSHQDEDRNLYLALQERMAIDKADYTRVFRALSAVSVQNTKSNNAFLDEFVDREAALHWLEKWQARLRTEKISNEERQAAMKRANPKFILRNYLAQQVIEAAEQGDYAPFDVLHDLLRKPFDEQVDREQYAALPPDWGRELEISCSS